jgi:hypothetical protein
LFATVKRQLAVPQSPDGPTKTFSCLAAQACTPQLPPHWHAEKFGSTKPTCAKHLFKIYIPAQFSAVAKNLPCGQ